MPTKESTIRLKLVGSADVTSGVQAVTRQIRADLERVRRAFRDEERAKASGDEAIQKETGEKLQRARVAQERTFSAAEDVRRKSDFQIQREEIRRDAAFQLHTLRDLRAKGQIADTEFAKAQRTIRTQAATEQEEIRRRAYAFEEAAWNENARRDAARQKVKAKQQADAQKSGVEQYVAEEQDAKRTAALEKQKAKEHAAVAGANKKIDDELYAAKHTREEVQLYKLRQNYMEQRRLHAGNAQALSKIDDTFRARLNTMLAQQEPGAAGPGGMRGVLSGFGGKMILGAAAGQAMGMLSGSSEFGSMVGRVIAGSMFGGPLIGVAVAGMELTGAAFQAYREKAQAAAMSTITLSATVGNMAASWSNLATSLIQRNPLGRATQGMAEAAGSAYREAAGALSGRMAKPISLYERFVVQLAQNPFPTSGKSIFESLDLPRPVSSLMTLSPLGLALSGRGSPSALPETVGDVEKNMFSRQMFLAHQARTQATTFRDAEHKQQMRDSKELLNARGQVVEVEKMKTGFAKEQARFEKETQYEEKRRPMEWASQRRGAAKAVIETTAHVESLQAMLKALPAANTPEIAAQRTALQSQLDQGRWAQKQADKADKALPEQQRLEQVEADQDYALKKAKLDEKYRLDILSKERESQVALVGADKVGYEKRTAMREAQFRIEEEDAKLHSDAMLDRQQKLHEKIRQADKTTAITNLKLQADQDAISARYAAHTISRKQALLDQMKVADPGLAATRQGLAQMERIAEARENEAVDAQKYQLKMTREQIAAQGQYIMGQITRLEMEKKIAVLSIPKKDRTPALEKEMTQTASEAWLLGLITEFQSPVERFNKQLDRIQAARENRIISPARERQLLRGTLDQALNLPTGQFTTMASRWREVQGAVLQPTDSWALLHEDMQGFGLAIQRIERLLRGPLTFGGA